MMECLMKEGAIFLCCHWSLLRINRCYECPTLLCCFKIWKIWKTSKMSHCYILQNLKRYFGILDRRTMTWLKKIILASLYRYKNIQKKISAFQETNFVQDFSKVLMSHCSNSPFWKWYKITISIITFLFGDGLQIRNMLHIQWEVPDYFKAYWPPHWLK